MNEPAAVYLPPSELRPWADNPRKNDQAVDAVADSIGRFGFGNPIVAWKPDDPLVIAGHTRLKASGKLGLEEVPVRFMPHLSLEEAKALAIADNKLNELADWDDPKLAAQVAALVEEGVDVSGLGFSDAELRDLAASLEPEPEGTGAPEPPEEPVSRRGEVYELGPHRLMCGDSTNDEDVALLLDGAKPNLMVTDPPYGINYDPTKRRDIKKAFGSVKATGTVENDNRASWAEAYGLFTGSVAYVWQAPILCRAGASDMESCGFEIRSMIVWAKPYACLTRSHYNLMHEVAWYAVRGQASWVGDNTQTTVIRATQVGNPYGRGDEDDKRTNHGTQKPIEVMGTLIHNHEGDVYDPFLGSGTTMIASQREGRRCYGMEISPAYCDVIRTRWGEYALRNGLEPGPDALLAVSPVG